MKHVPFTKDLGKKLLDEGYNHFVLANYKDSSVFHHHVKLTLQPTKDLTVSKTLPIRQMIALTEDKLDSIYVLCED